MAARVFVDTNVLFPFSVMDVMLALTEDSVHEIVWSERLLAEWERVIVREGRRSAESAAAVAQAVRRFFADCEIPAAAYGHLVDEMPGDDPDDRHHAAAAVAAGADALITWNRADFPAGDLAEHGVRVIDPDSYLCGLYGELPHEVAETVVRLAGEKRNPPVMLVDAVARLAKAGLPRFADVLTRHLEYRAG
ncbi:PIN domain-containing protein [Streptomyces erythrochromogenes]|uniref:PIN domain-containing protein n=1 Tax=Streptomyces erythrochromogenes TaxID=285574 RepID=UPI00225A89A3|nr:PIN domain-containing protein [Streptomyces erythrochromogenes]MCX5585583.1 PIN domain-containing protein [Streptomyces erythrochromogenes]